MLLDLKRDVWGRVRAELFEKFGREYLDQYDIPQDIEDLALLDLIEETELALTDIRCRKLMEIEEALKRLEEGRYGICVDCGGDIDEERLRVVPFTVSCVACQREKE
ncbi:MAG: TraR/DksA family transcriptional regulator [Deltaproteobacteria bacterium]|nr:TraR/DksA family transcriptional regulator [Deltaproteobacteria bacterium]